MKLTDFKALTFDCYGTLIDWESGIVDALELLTARVDRELTRDDILNAHARHESAQQAQTPGKSYRGILSVVYRRLGEEWGVAAPYEECMRYSNSPGRWPAFADSGDALAYLKSHYKLIILSNIDNASFESSRRKLGIDFDAVYTAEDIGSYKPDARNFDYMLRNLQALGLDKTDILHTAESLFHDHAPANRAGIASCWIHRRHDQDGFGAAMPPEPMPKLDFQFNSLAELVAAHRAEVAKAAQGV